VHVTPFCVSVTYGVVWPFDVITPDVDTTRPLASKVTVVPL
jgi:hypothetical protein